MKEPVTYPNGDTLRVCIVGAGFSGLCAAIQLKKQLGLTSFTIFESNNDVGGTWLTNIYPGCACDVPSHLYSYSFEPNPGWSEHYSSQPEIWRYIKRVAEKHDLYPHIKFETEVKSLSWNESKQNWKVVTVDKNSNQQAAAEFDVIINGPGALRVANIPEEFKSFKGQLIHSAEWDPTVKLDNKIVGIIGSGASAVQIVPKIAPNVKELHAYQRKPAWVMPRMQSRFPGFVKSILFYVPFIHWLFRCCLFLMNEFLLPAFKKGSWMSRVGTNLGRKHIRQQIPNKELQQKMTPSYTFGCKRITPSSDYYPALCLPNVTVHDSKIVEVKRNGIETEDGNLQDLDVLILATGYRVQDYFAPMQVFGRNSEDILNTWKTKIPMSYFGIVSSATPNHFILLGPNTALGHNTVIFMIECQVNFAISVIREMMKRDARFAAVKVSAEKNFMTWIHEELKNTVWGSSSCGSWYVNKDGAITTIWPESCISYWNKTRKPNFSHFEFK